MRDNVETYIIVFTLFPKILAIFHKRQISSTVQHLAFNRLCLWPSWLISGFYLRTVIEFDDHIQFSNFDRTAKKYCVIGFFSVSIN